MGGKVERQALTFHQGEKMGVYTTTTIVRGIEFETEVPFSVSGRHIRATLYEPEEWPEIYIEEPEFYLNPGRRQVTSPRLLAALLEEFEKTAEELPGKIEEYLADQADERAERDYEERKLRGRDW